MIAPARCDHSIETLGGVEHYAVEFCRECNVLRCRLCGEQFFSNARKAKTQVTAWPMMFSSTSPAEWTAVHEPLDQSCKHESH